MLPTLMLVEDDRGNEMTSYGCPWCLAPLNPMRRNQSGRVYTCPVCDAEWGGHDKDSIELTNAGRWGRLRLLLDG